MSEVMEKAVAALPGLLSESLGVSSDKDWGHSRNFQAFVKHISNLKNKAEEDALLERELSLQKQKLAQPNQTPMQTKESLIRVLYCHMLGKDVSFACIHAVKLAQQGSVLDKKVGYLVCSILMNKDHELVMLLINTMQKDLSSSNVLYNLAGLTGVIHLCGTEMVPAILPLVKEKLNHPKDAVRKKAVMAMHHFLQLTPEMINHEMACLQRMLADKDPSVVWAMLHIFSELVPKEPSSYRYLVPGLISILGQIVGRNLSTDYDYHTVPAPWMTIMLLRLLAKLGAHDESASQQIYPALKDVLQKTEPSHKMGLAVIFECLQTITRIYPHPYLLQQAVSCVGKFIYAKNINLKYLGLKALVSLVTISSECTMEHQEVVLDCLEHPDPTIQRMTLQLLYQMANRSNVKVISDKMLEFMSTTSDQVIRSDIVHKVINLTERYSADLLSYLKTMNQVIKLAENFIPDDTVQTVLWRISRDCVSTGDESDPLANKQLRAAVFQLYMQLLQSSSLPDTLIEISAWVLGEYNHCVQGVAPNQVVSTLLASYRNSQVDRTRCQIISALQKMAYYITDLSAVMNVLETSNVTIGSSYHYELRQRIQELELLCTCKQDIKIAANPETRYSLDKMDLTLTFLDEFVCEALEAGATPYRPQISHLSLVKHEISCGPSSTANLNFTPYETSPVVSKSGLRSTSASVSSDSTDTRETSLKLKSKKRVWTKEGVINKAETDVQDKERKDETGKEQNVAMAHNNEQEAQEITAKQLKRKQLAEAIFGEVKPKGQQHEQARLINLSTGSLDEKTDASSSVAGLNSLVQRSQSSHVISHSVGLNSGASWHEMNSANNKGFVPSDSKNSLSRLLDYDTITPTEVLPGPFFISSNVDNLENEMAQNNTVHARGSTLGVNLTCVPASHDDAGDSLVCSSQNSSFMLLSKDTKPSPWKLIGGKQAETVDEDSISIEVDSIEEDEPPSEFRAEAACVGDDLRTENSNKYHILDARQQQLERVRSTRKCVIAENGICLCECEKVYRSEDLVLMLRFRLKGTDDRNVDERAARLGSLLIEDCSYSITELCQLEDSSDQEIHVDPRLPVPVKFPSSIMICVKNSSLPPLEPLVLTLSLAGDAESRRVDVDLILPDFLRPLALDVEQFAEAWTADDGTVLRRTSVITREHKGHGEVIKDIGFQIIQEKGSEVILASRWLSADRRVLLHTKRSSDTIQVSVKGQPVQLVSAVTSYVHELLAPTRDDVHSCPAFPGTAGPAQAGS